MGVLLIVAVPFALAAMYALWQRARWGGMSFEVEGLLVILGFFWWLVWSLWG